MSEEASMKGGGRRRRRKQTPASKSAAKVRRTNSPSAWTVEEVDFAPSISDRSELPTDKSLTESDGTTPTSFSVDDVVKLLSSIKNNDKQRSNFMNNSQLNNVIPEFDSSSKT